MPSSQPHIRGYPACIGDPAFINVKLCKLVCIRGLEFIRGQRLIEEICDLLRKKGLLYPILSKMSGIQYQIIQLVLISMELFALVQSVPLQSYSVKRLW